MTCLGRFLCRYKSPPSFVACHSSTFVNSCRWQVTILSTQGERGAANVSLRSVCFLLFMFMYMNLNRRKRTYVLSSTFPVKAKHRNYFKSTLCSFPQAKTREAVNISTSILHSCPPHLTFVFCPAVIGRVESLNFELPRPLLLSLSYHCFNIRLSVESQYELQVWVWAEQWNCTNCKAGPPTHPCCRLH